jgi:Carboxylesterase family
MSAKNFTDRVKRLAGDHAPTMLAAYDEGSPHERFNALITDKAFAVPAARLAEAQAHRAPVFAYRFDWRSNYLGGLMGACHAPDIGFTFGTHNKRLVGAFFGTGIAAEAPARDMMESWIAFARTGDPPTSSSGTGPRYNATTRSTVIFGDGAPHTRHRTRYACAHGMRCQSDVSDLRVSTSAFARPGNVLHVRPLDSSFICASTSLSGGAPALSRRTQMARFRSRPGLCLHAPRPHLAGLRRRRTARS